MLTFSRRHLCTVVSAWASTQNISFRRADGYRQATKQELADKGTDLDLHVVPAYVIPDFISSEEEQALLKFTDCIFAPLAFADGHYDNLIERYKEFYRNWHTLSEEIIAETLEDAQQMHGSNDFVDTHKLDVAATTVRAVLERTRQEAQSFVPSVPLQERVHFLQLQPHGFIRAHADEERNSSAIVAGLTLGSGRVMTLTHPEHPGPKVDLLLAPRSLYVLAGAARTQWHHSVDAEGEKPVAPLRGSPVLFEGRETGITREQRTAIIFRGMSPMELFMHRMVQKQVGKQKAAAQKQP